MQQASVLPTVEHSLEEFIAKANQTLVDVSGWGNADAEAKEADVHRREQDALRMKAAETQMREGEAREQSLRRQLDGLQGKLAEAEARAAVAGTAVGSAAHDQTLSQLRAQIETAEAQRRAVEAEKAQLSSALSQAHAEVQAARTSGSISQNYAIPNDDAEERVRVAEAKAAQALAAAKAAQMGVSVDLTSIENGLSIPIAHPNGGNTGLKIAAAFLGGLGIMAAIYFLVLKKDVPAPAAVMQAAPATQQGVTPTPMNEKAAAAKPTVEPIKEELAKEEPAVAAKPTAEPIEEAVVAPVPVRVNEAAVVAKEEPKAEPVAIKVEPVAVKVEPKPGIVKAAAKEPKKQAPKPEPKKAAKSGSIVDPFSAATPKKAPAKKPASGGVVDPF